MTTAMITAIATTSKMCVRTPRSSRTSFTPAEVSVAGGRSVG